MDIIPTYTSEQSRKRLEHWNAVGRELEKYMKSLTRAQVEELIRKAVPDAYPDLTDAQIDVCVAHEMDQIASMGGFCAYYGTNLAITIGLLKHMPQVSWRYPPSEQTEAANSPDGTDVGEQAGG